MLKIDFNPPDKQLSQFAWVALVGFPLVGFALSKTFGLTPSLPWILGGVGVVTWMVGLLAPRLILPVYVGLMVVAAPIGFVLSWTLMGLVYFGLFTPVGLAFRAMGRDKLHKYPDPQAKSYWHERGTPRPAVSYFKLY